MKLEKIFNVKVVKYNFDDPCLVYKRKYVNYPTENNIMESLRCCNDEYPMYISYNTTVHIEEYYEVNY